MTKPRQKTRQAYRIGLLLVAVASVSVAVLLRINMDNLSPTTIEVLINRTPTSYEVYMRLPGANLEDVFASDTSVLKQRSGSLAFDKIRNGTWQFGDALFGKLSATANGRALKVETMSMMVHPASLHVPFRDVIDGATAVGVCAVEPPAGPVNVNQTTAFIGLFISKKRLDRTVDLKFPVTKRSPIRAHVKEFRHGQFQSAYMRAIPDGGTLSIGRQSVAQIIQ
ncbi:MAG: hypothetical protein AAGB04_02615 [Pseudomonadota bacterium]